MKKGNCINSCPNNNFISNTCFEWTDKTLNLASLESTFQEINNI